MAHEIRFDWDEANTSHLARHNVRREEAEQAVLNGFVELEVQAMGQEERYVVVGHTNRARFLTLVFTTR